ncbi:hypothetical protein LSH36_2g04019 [Paralvinella palmiformis]|uniref:Uncharacterized protein n=1 Tax=Paralvinella palmiformis TaxID=53620 RepID=A0AAD9NJ75_9ANNE|nr:hypothetical protein LSH36_2g04019 [Paralvinella palmiformis]
MSSAGGSWTQLDTDSMSYEVLRSDYLRIMMSLKSSIDQDPDLLVQLDAFDQSKESDDEQLAGPRGVDLNNPIDVFHAVFSQVSSFFMFIYIYIYIYIYI